AALAGSSECLLTAAPDKPVYGAVLFSMFFHADLLHLGFNMLFLWVFGNNVEDFFGSMRFAAVYLLCGVIGTAAFAAANPEGTLTLVGASGAVAGVLGSYLLLHPTARVTVVVLPLIFLAFQLPALVVLGAWFLLQLREVGGHRRPVEEELLARAGAERLNQQKRRDVGQDQQAHHPRRAPHGVDVTDRDQHPVAPVAVAAVPSLRPVGLVSCS
ncbi:MAG: hypothetical protein BRC31_09160, partial [Actinobacteria bacterium QS_5_72_10]